MQSKKKVRPSRIELNERSFLKAKGETHTGVINRILSDLREFNFYGRYDLIRKVAEHPKLPPDLQPIYPRGERFFRTHLNHDYLSGESYHHWLLGLFNRHSQLLREFIEKRQSINGAVLRGDSAEALNLISEISIKSESWWAIESSIHITKELACNDTKIAIKELLERFSGLNLSVLTRDLSLLSESTSVDFYVEAVLSRIREYRRASIPNLLEFGAVESTIHLPMYHDPERKAGLTAFHNFGKWPLFDQYMLYRSVLMDADEPALLLSNHFDEILKLATLLNDWELINILCEDDSEDAFVKNIVEIYTLGNYKKVIENVLEAIAKNLPNLYSLIEIYARAKIYESKIGVGVTFFDKIADEFAKILILDPKSADSIDYLNNIAVKFRKEAWAKSLLYHLASMQEYTVDELLVETARRQTLCLGKFNTPKARASNFSPIEFSRFGPGQVPEHRILRHSIPDEVTIKADVFPIYSDFLKTQARHLLQTNSIWVAANFCIAEYAKNRLAFLHLPFLSLCNKIIQLDRAGDFNHLIAMVIIDIFDRECGSSFDEFRADVFQEFLDSHQTHRPSQIVSVTDISANTAYFLRYICIPAQLDNIIEFSSYDEVIHERVAIIDLLISARSEEIEELRSERDKVLETLFSEKLRAKIEAGKLYVDVQALESHRRLIYADLYAHAKSLDGELIWEPLTDLLDKIESADVLKSRSNAGLSKGSGDKFTVLAKIYLHMAYDFALNEKYGLDKYLSAEIRHVVFSSQLRACFEKYNLVTPQKNGQYLQNTYWAELYHYVPPSIIDQLDVTLGEFSKNVDEILAKVNDRFKVSITDASGQHLLDFSPKSERVTRVAEIINQSNSFEKFFGEIIGLMWEVAVDGARSAQQLINDVLMPEILSAVDQVESEIQEYKGIVAMFDLMQAIKNARSEFKQEIELVLNWFRFVGSERMQTFEPLGVVIEAAVSSFKSIFEHKGKALVYKPTRSHLILSYREARSLFISLFTALENALRYSASDTSVIISHGIYEKVDRLTISNTMATLIEDPVGFVRSKKDEWVNEYSKLNTEEGGTGLYKIHNLLTVASPGFGFEILIEKSNFNACIELNHEYFDHRRQST